MTAPASPSEASRAAVTLAALGIVFGDIGTSPLYAFRESFLGLAHLDVTPDHIYGVLSMMTWSLIIVISIKYLSVVLRADNNGEGGIIALVARIDPSKKKAGRFHALAITMGIFGASLLYGDGTITPAISVLSAIEGMEVAIDGFDRFTVPVALCILIGLFSAQRFGTAHIGKVFGPAMIVWFLLLAVLGIGGIIQSPEVLIALSPHWAVQFLIMEPATATIVLGVVFLVVTGGEALYADLGHFGRASIRRAWFMFVFPALLLNYFGQGGLVLSDAGEIEHPFFHLAPEWATIPLVVIATIATVIASQAVISGVFSLTRQAIQLHLLPRMNIVQTSEDEFGQIYIPAVNWMMMIATCGLVVFFQTSSALSSAYGLAIAIDMLITSILVFMVLHQEKWSPWLIAGLAVLFIPLDLVFLGSNALKFMDGGWYPVMIGLGLFTLIATWRAGVKNLLTTTRRLELSSPQFVDWIADVDSGIVRADGMAIFLTSKETGVPAILRHCVERTHALQKVVLLVHVKTTNQAHVAAADRAEAHPIMHGIWHVDLTYGYADRIDLPKALDQLSEQIADTQLVRDATYYIGRSALLPVGRRSLSRWRAILYDMMARNEERATAYFKIPRGQVIEIGMQITV